MLNTLVTIMDQKAVTTSCVIADAFERPHKDVLRAISRVECSAEFAERNFAPGSYLDVNRQMRPMFTITRDGFSFLAFCFTGKRAAEFKEKFIAAFNSLEQALIEGRGDRRSVDVNHTRAMNEHGMDIRYNLDLTKIVNHPTRRNLAVLERLTGVPLTDLLTETPEKGETPNYVAQFVKNRCHDVDDSRRITFKQFYERFREWYGAEVDARHFGIPSKIEASRRLRVLGYTIPDAKKTGGMLYVYGLGLA